MCWKKVLAVLAVVVLPWFLSIVERSHDIFWHPKEFETEDLAVQAVKQLAGVDFHGRKLSVQPFGQARGRLWMSLAAL
jgi:hypothetical protein